MKHINNCPVCQETASQEILSIKDHFLSHETFILTRCTSCGFVFTNPRPEDTDLEKYYQSDAYFSHSKKKKGLITFLYDAVKNYSLGKKYRLITSYKKPGTILDIGCATGEFLNYFAKEGWNCTGIEPAINPRKYAIEKYNLDVKTEEGIEQLDSQSFDVISLWHVLEHVPVLNERMRQIYRMLKPNGLLVIALPNYRSWDAQHYGKFWAGYDVPRHLYHFDKSSVEKLLNNHQFTLSEIKPMKFDSFYVSLLSEKYKSKKMNYVRALINGLKSNNKAGRKQNNYSSLIYLAKKSNS